MENTKDLSDRDILLRASEDHNYLAVLVERYRTPLYNFVYRFVGLRETAEDIVQETFMRCLKHSHKCPPIEYVSTWLYTIAANLAKTELRRRKRWQWVPIEADEKEERSSYYEPVDGEPLPDQQTDTEMARWTIVQAIEELPEEFREAVLLRDLNGLAYEEIARITRSPIGTIKSRVNRGRIRLQKELLPLGEEVIGALS
jgi:RNA polymerase sigma-70 factor (ECF subfamily)